jgi:hypothetical protein
MSIAAYTQLNVRADGSDLNGGGYNPNRSGAGTDYSLQAAAQLLVTDGGCANATAFTSAAAGFTALMVGSVMQITDIGTNGTLGFFEIVAYVSPTQVTLDRVVTAGQTATGMTARVGGALATATAAATVSATSLAVSIKYSATPYDFTGILAPQAGGNNPGMYTKYSGYFATPGDLDGSNDRTKFPSFRAVAGFPATGYLVQLNNSYVAIENIICDGNSIAQDGIGGSGTLNRATNCEFKNFTRNGARIVGGTRLRQCSFSNNTGGDAYITPSGTPFNSVYDCTFNAGPGPAIYLGNATATQTPIVRNRIFNKTGATGHAVQVGVTPGSLFFVENEVDGMAGDGINASGYMDPACIQANLFLNITGQRLRCVNGQLYKNLDADRNAWYAAATVGSLTLPGPNDIALTVDPCVNRAGGNYALNSSNPGGAQIKGKGAAATAAGLPSTPQNIDIGAIQSAGSGGSGGIKRTSFGGGF